MARKSKPLRKIIDTRKRSRTTLPRVPHRRVFAPALLVPILRDEKTAREIEDFIFGETPDLAHLPGARLVRATEPKREKACR